MVHVFDEDLPATTDAPRDYDEDTLRKIFCTRVDGDTHAEVYSGKYRNWIFIAPSSDTSDMPRAARENIQYCDWFVKSVNDDGTFRLYGYCKVRNPKKQDTIQQYFPTKLELMPCTLYRLKTSGYRPFNHVSHDYYGMFKPPKTYRELIPGYLDDDIEYNLNPVNRFFGYIRPVSNVKLEQCRIVKQVAPILDDPLPKPNTDFVLPHFTAYARGLTLQSDSPPLSPEPTPHLLPEPSAPIKKRFYSVEICRIEDLSGSETDVYSSPDSEEKFKSIVDNICICESRKERNKIVKLG